VLLLCPSGGRHVITDVTKYKGVSVGGSKIKISLY
jgi:hypothetical protein